MESGTGRVAVATGAVAIEQAESDKCVEEVAGAAFGEAKPLAQCLAVEGPLSEGSKDAELHCAHQRLGTSERVTEFQDAFQGAGAAHDLVFHYG